MKIEIICLCLKETKMEEKATKGNKKKAYKEYKCPQCKNRIRIGARI